MADLAARIPQVGVENRPLMEAGFAILGIAFLVKAGMWPLSFWLPTTYGAASAPVAALFAIMSKVGLYILLRLSVFLGEGSGMAGFGLGWLFYGGMATMVFGTIGILSSQDMPRMTAFAVLLSSGTTMAMLGFGDPAVTGGAMYYWSLRRWLSRPLLLSELMERGRSAEASIIAVTSRLRYDEVVDRMPRSGLPSPQRWWSSHKLRLLRHPRRRDADALRLVGKFASSRPPSASPGTEAGVPATTWVIFACSSCPALRR